MWSCHQCHQILRELSDTQIVSLIAIPWLLKQFLLIFASVPLVHIRNCLIYMQEKVQTPLSTPLSTPLQNHLVNILKAL